MGGWMGDLQILLNFLQLIVFYGFLVVIVWMLRKLTKDIGNIKQSITDLQELIMQMPRPEVPSRPRRVARFPSREGRKRSPRPQPALPAACRAWILAPG